MTLKELKTISTIELIDKLGEAKGNKIEWNLIVYEITCRMYIPFQGISFEDLLLRNGYIIDKDKRDDINMQFKK